MPPHIRRKRLKKRREYVEKWVKKNQKRVKASGKIRRAKQRLEVLRHYSNGTPCCACCGEEEIKFLSLDHISGGGNKERKKIGYGNLGIWLKSKKFPMGIQVLCLNCNLAKGFYGKCPHKIK